MLVGLACKYFSCHRLLVKIYQLVEKVPGQKKHSWCFPSRYLKVFHWVPHDLIAVNLNAYGLSIDAVTFLYST